MNNLAAKEFSYTKTICAEISAALFTDMQESFASLPTWFRELVEDPSNALTYVTLSQNEPLSITVWLQAARLAASQATRSRAQEHLKSLREDNGIPSVAENLSRFLSILAFGGKTKHKVVVAAFLDFIKKDDIHEVLSRMVAEARTRGMIVDFRAVAFLWERMAMRGHVNRYTKASATVHALHNISTAPVARTSQVSFGGQSSVNRTGQNKPVQKSFAKFFVPAWLPCTICVCNGHTPRHCPLKDNRTAVEAIVKFLTIEKYAMVKEKRDTLARMTPADQRKETALHQVIAAATLSADKLADLGASASEIADVKREAAENAKRDQSDSNCFSFPTRDQRQNTRPFRGGPTGKRPHARG